MKTNKVCIFNYWWSAVNYGAILTAYSLQKLVDNFGYDSYLVDNSRKSHLFIYNNFNFSQKFAKSYLKTTSWIHTYTDLKNLSKDCNTFIVGSDQVFNKKIARSNFEQFMLLFADINAKKIAVSACFGKDETEFINDYSEEEKEIFKKSLSIFDYISLREESGVDICKNILGIGAKLIFDPVLLLDTIEFDKLAEKSKFNVSGKIVTYLMHPKNKLKADNDYVNLFASNLSVEDWISAIKNCKYLITDSFHGTCFALLFNKPFICVVNSANGNSRFNSVFNNLGIKNQSINSVEDISEDKIFDIDYNTVNEKISEQRKLGLQFLEDALKGEKNHSANALEIKTEYLEKRIMQMEKEFTLKNKFIKNFKEYK